MVCHRVLRCSHPVVVGLPDVRGRVEILKHHMGDVRLDVDVDPSIIARGTPGMSGADLQNLVNQASLASIYRLMLGCCKGFARGSQERPAQTFRVGQRCVQAKTRLTPDRILMGAERRSHYVTDASKRATAYHEGGHALVALHTPGAMPLHKVYVHSR